MRFQSQVFWVPKDFGYAPEYEDAFEVDEARGTAAIADGVASAIFSGAWARLLTHSVVKEPPELEEAVAFRDWLETLRGAWRAEIDPGKLKYYQRAKLVDGAMSTLLWLVLLPAADGDATERPEGRCRFRSVAIGDCCLFHVRQGEVLRVFPIESSSDFGLDPAVIGSVDRQRDHLLEFNLLEDECLASDLLVLCTDALGQWAVRRWEAGDPVDWEKYWGMSAEAWQEEIAGLRAQGSLRFDDTTLILLRVVEGSGAIAPPPAASDEVVVEVVEEGEGVSP